MKYVMMVNVLDGRCWIGNGNGNGWLINEMMVVMVDDTRNGWLWWGFLSLVPQLHRRALELYLHQHLNSTHHPCFQLNRVKMIIHLGDFVSCRRYSILDFISDRSYYHLFYLLHYLSFIPHLRASFVFPFLRLLSLVYSHLSYQHVLHHPISLAAR